jgi:hypothetical protein
MGMAETNYLDGPGKDIQLRKKEEKLPNNNGDIRSLFYLIFTLCCKLYTNSFNMQA